MDTRDGLLDDAFYQTEGRGVFLEEQVRRVAPVVQNHVGLPVLGGDALVDAPPEVLFVLLLPGVDREAFSEDRKNKDERRRESYSKSALEIDFEMLKAAPCVPVESGIFLTLSSLFPFAHNLYYILTGLRNGSGNFVLRGIDVTSSPSNRGTQGNQRLYEHLITRVRGRRRRS